MCGIFVMLNNTGTYSQPMIKSCFEKGGNRGPEYSVLKQVHNNEQKIVFGFHRLAINGLNAAANQPLKIGNITLICNGEIYNYKHLFQLLNIKPHTDSDCEIIIHLYKQHGIAYTLQLLDGVFAFALYDHDTESVFLARDPYGVRPLYAMLPVTSTNKSLTSVSTNITNEPIIAFASEIKMLNGLFNAYGSNTQLIYNELGHHLGNYHSPYKIVHFNPGTYMSYRIPSSSIPSSSISNKKIWIPYMVSTKYHTFNFHSPYPKIDDKINIMKNIYQYLNQAVKKRVIGTTDRPIACLLSGGLDSSLIAALVSKYYTTNEQQLETYSIGMEGSEDLFFAQKVAEHIGSKHTSVIVSEDDFFNAIPDVICAIESYDTTTVRASVGNYLLGKYIAQHSSAKVIFNGDGSDELTGGYLYFQEVPNNLEFDKECKRLLTDLHAFDVLRSDKCISSHGLEPRTPFLDREWVDYYLSIPPSIRNHAHDKNNKEQEKYLLRRAFSTFEPTLLPVAVLWRRKEAFSDGVSGKHKSWFEIIQDRLDCADEVANIPVANIHNTYNFHNIPQTKEQKYYRDIYDAIYPNTSNVVPYFWMPRYVDAIDASARTLKLY